MAQSTGPMITVGLITWTNRTILEPSSDPLVKTTARIAVGTAIAVGGLSFVERGSPELAKGLAWVALVTVLFTRIGGQRAPVENLLRWWRATA